MLLLPCCSQSPRLLSCCTHSSRCYGMTVAKLLMLCIQVPHVTYLPGTGSAAQQQPNIMSQIDWLFYLVSSSSITLFQTLLFVGGEVTIVGSEVSLLVGLQLHVTACCCIPAEAVPQSQHTRPLYLIMLCICISILHVVIFMLLLLLVCSLSITSCCSLVVYIHVCFMIGIAVCFVCCCFLPISLLP